LILVLGAVLVLFGAKKIPEFAKGLGQGMREFKKASREVTTELETAMNSECSHKIATVHPSNSVVSEQAPNRIQTCG
jgi:sec-independent protein translocase protein TatA